jgi:hypothetical protein
MRKRQKFVFTSVLLTLGFYFIQLASLELRYALVFLFISATWILSAWSLREGLVGIEWFTVLMPSTVFSGAMALFYVLLPQFWLAKIAVVILFLIGTYALLLCGNIFSVAAIRTIALLRAAQTVGFITTLVTGFMLYNTVFSFHLGFWFSAPLVFLITFLLILPALWTIEVGEKWDKNLLILSLFVSLWTMMFSVAISFWPVSLVMTSLFLTTVLYSLLGITQHHISQRLNPRMIWEYLIVSGIVTVITLFVSI